GTFGKALGSYGAYVAASQGMIDFLVNRARSYIFSTALPPAVAAASLAAVQLIQREPRMQQELRERVALFKEALRQGGLRADLGPTQIIPLQLGESAKAVAAAQYLREHGLFVPAVRPPTVPEGTARLRFSITRHLGEADLKAAATAILSLRH
ncbi:MAG TPA: aminotransferase class I/II-fold pyridoxal phosphate-dependent enzyme, partial [Desulfurivibrionaceae bacterium]|nr:aminotransferase class I/II-fold pyridoxal phosphate-dependent enzyme [Desulfurivibrionaceae bacterium]